jgi:hypothetical protein
MLRGTMLSIRARREASPMADSMCASSAALNADVAGNEFAGVFKFGRGCTAAERCASDMGGFPKGVRALAAERWAGGASRRFRPSVGIELRPG